MKTKNDEYSTIIYKWWSDTVMCFTTEMFYDFIENELQQKCECLESDKDRMIIHTEEGYFILEEHKREGFYNEILISRFFDYDNRKKKGTLFELK